MIIDSIVLKTTLIKGINKYSGFFYINYEVPSSSIMRTKIVPFFSFDDCYDRIEDRSGIFSKYNKDLETKHIVTQYVRYQYYENPFMPYGIFLWFDQKLSNEYRIEPIIDEERKYVRDYFDDDEEKMCLIGFKIHFSSFSDQMKYKLLSE